MITFTLNGREVQGEKGESLIQVANRYGVSIPTLCYHKALDPAGMCRLCTVELYDGRKTRFVTACNYPIWEGMEVYTDTEAVHSGRKLIVELLLARCPNVPLLKDLAREYGIVEPRFPRENDDCILCGLCTRMCERMGNGAISLTGRGMDMRVDTPFHFQTELCKACGACASICPTGHIKVEEIARHAFRAIPSEYDMGLRPRKPIYVPYAQAMPNIPVIDRTACMHFKTGGCKLCTEFCDKGAIDHAQQEETLQVEVGAIILAPGFRPFDPTNYSAYPYKRLPNVVTSMEFERILSASGPFTGHLVRISDHKEPRKIAWIQCVGSRDIHPCDHGYCSSVCCMVAVKQAIVAKEHAGDSLDCTIFFIDMRTPGKDFERYYTEARDRHGVRFIRSRVPTIDPVLGTEDLSIPYVDEDGRVKRETFDMVVLSVGVEISMDVRALAQGLGVDLTQGGFCHTGSFRPVVTSREGVYVCGAFQGPKDIPQSVIEASAAAAEVGALLSRARNTRTRTHVPPVFRDVKGERPKIGVFVCHCGINIGSVVDVPAVRDYAATLPYVEFVADNLFSCSTDTQDAMARVIQEKGLNRMVVAACTPKTHEPLFQETLVSAGLNRYLLEMTNIRNQDAWVHRGDPRRATEKAMDLVRMAVAKAALSEPLSDTVVEIKQKALVVGGGISGMVVAKTLSAQGYAVCLVERDTHLGGQARRLFRTWKGEEIPSYVEGLIKEIQKDPKIDIRLNTEIQGVEGFVGNFRTAMRGPDGAGVVEHGIAVIATGALEWMPNEYEYQKDPRVLTHLDLDRRLIERDPSLKEVRTAVFIQCVGSREPQRPYCSRVCCTHSMESALLLKALNPTMKVYILYRDLRTYGEREYLYRKARLAGILFIPYGLSRKPSLRIEEQGLRVEVWDQALGRSISMGSDLVILASAIVPQRNEPLAQLFKLPLNQDGFFMEAHAKLGPSEFATDGVFLCGMAHYPKPVDESIAQAQAAAARAVTLLSKTSVAVSGAVAYVDQRLCSGCGVCVEICPYSATSFAGEGAFPGKAAVNPVLCKGCGLCVTSCRSGAINLKGFEEGQLMAMIEAL